MLEAFAAEIYARLKEDGCGAREIVHVSGELLALVTAGITKADPRESS